MSADALLAAADGAAQGALTAWLRTQRWFGAKGRPVASVTALDAWDAANDAGLVLLEVRYADGSASERYVGAFALADADDTDGPDTVGALRDASDSADLSASVLALIATSGSGKTARGGEISGRPGDRDEDRAALARARALTAQRLRAEQSNTSYVLGDVAVLKLLRRPQPGPHPDDEVVRFLTARGFRHVPPALGTLWYRGPGESEPTALALAQAFVPNHGDAWSATLHALQGVLAGGDERESIEAIERLGAVTGELHAALASAGNDAPEFAPRPLDDTERQSLCERSTGRIARIRDVAARSAGLWPGELSTRMASLVARAEPAVQSLRDAGGAVPAGLSVIRVHGDYHLGQVLVTDAGYAVIDFEGEPALPIAARRARSSALRDVAGMLRSLDYASHVAAREAVARGAGDVGARASAWERSARAAFLRGYVPAARGTPVVLLPDDGALPRALAAYELEKALYEVLYEVDHRPDWVSIPALGVERALDALGY